MFAQYFSELWEISTEAAPFLCLGFTLGALLHRYVKPEWMMRLLGKGKVRSTITAAAIGVPLPLCSCSVVPTALAIQKKGASKGATLAFLISTPETGADSILLTYGLLGPLMAVIRPLAALLSAIMAGLLLESFPEKEPFSKEKPPEAKPSCCSSKAAGLRIPTPHKPLGKRAWEQIQGITKSLFLLFDEVVVWLMVGLILSAVVSSALPENLLASGLGSGWTGRLLALVIGLPMYVCATASTPLAAALMEKGLSAGAALVFLLVGPATNIGTIGIVAKVLGKRGVASYLVAIVSIALLFGTLVDQMDLYWHATESLHAHHHPSGSLGRAVTAAMLWGMILWRLGRRLWRRNEEASSIQLSTTLGISTSQTGK
jgi:uncharacterized protein